MAYISSSNIDVFPATNRSDAYFSKSRSLSEVNLTDCDFPAYKNYIVSTSLNAVPFQFVLDGHFIQVKSDLLSLLDFGANNDIFVSAQVDASGNFNSDSGGNYTGVVFATNTSGLDSYMQLRSGANFYSDNLLANLIAKDAIITVDGGTTFS